jgi:tripartite-type tricarboxylate transporter receptor subunit TctC
MQATSSFRHPNSLVESVPVASAALFSPSGGGVARRATEGVTARFAKFASDPTPARAGGPFPQGREVAVLVTLVFAGLAPFVLPTSAHAEDAASFYRGKTVTVVIASAAGGGFDAYGRLVARHIGAHIPGTPNVIPQNLPGAAGANAASYVVGVAPKDGTVIGAIHPGNIIEPVLGDKRKVRFDPNAFQYIGNANSDVYVCVTRTDAPAKTFAEALSKELIMGSGGEAASTKDFPVMLTNVLGAKFKMILGYSGNRDVQLAIEKGEIHGECGAGWSSVLSAHPDWFKNNLVRVLVQEASVGHPDLDRLGVPKTVDFAKTPEQRAVLDLVYSQERFGRPYIMAPETPTDRVAMMRKAFIDTFNDSAFLAEAKRMNLDVSPTTGEETQALVRKVFATPADIVEKAKAATMQKPE